MTTVIALCCANFCSQKLKRRILTTFGVNRTALRAIQPNLYSMFCALFLKIALSILVQRHNWAIFLRKWARWGRYSQWRSLSGHVERIFVHKNWRGRYWHHLVSTGRRYVPYSEATLDVLHPVFEDRIISHRADVVWPPWSCDLTPLYYQLWGAVQDKCYADKSETIDALKDNIRKAIGEIQLHTIDNVLKNWTDRVGYAWPAGQPFEWNYFPLLTGRFVLSNKK